MKPVAPTIRTRPLAEETEGVTVMLGSDEFVLWFLLHKGQVLVLILSFVLQRPRFLQRHRFGRAKVGTAAMYNEVHVFKSTYI